MPSVSIIIPTNRSRDVLEPCLCSIAQQSFDLCEVEVVVVFNGGVAAPRRDATAWPFRLITEHIERAHIGAAKNVALERAAGEWVILLNDDVFLDPDFIQAHLAAHRRLGRPAMVLGRSAWRQCENDTVFDRMIQTTSMIFFYDKMKAHTWYNFRHAWNLNLSLPRRCLATLRFDERLGPFFYEDLELAYRLEQELGLRVWYAPQALLLHNHRYTLDQYLQREYAMGQVAPALWRANPACFRATYGADLDETYAEYCRRFVADEGRREGELRSRLAGVVTRRPDEIAAGVELQDELVQLLYQAHLPLKRLAFRRGVLSALEGAAAPATLETAPCPA